jgi:DNA polymerase III delta prime subunit
MEQYSTSRFILTCNYPHRIIPAIHSRTQSLVINKLPIDDFTVRMAEILVAENIDFELDILDDYVRGCRPDLRKLINNCQQNCINGKLIKPEHNDSTRDYKIDAVELFKTGKFREARALICSQIRAEELEEFFTWCYNNLDLFGKTDQQKDAVILVIRKGMVQIPLAADAEILVAATLVELGQIQ